MLATGGAVSNTGVALHVLGTPVTLMGKIGRDSFGQAVLDVLRRYGSGLEKGMVVVADAVTSYTVVINIPEKDRIFLHCPGANDTFGSEDVPAEKLQGASLFHLGYPPIMARTYAEGGKELDAIYTKVKAAGLTTSLDMVCQDPGGPSGRADWKAIFARVLPKVDIFLPSADELLYAVDRARFGEGDKIDGDTLAVLGRQLLDMGVAIAGVKLGSRGLYIRTAGAARLKAMGDAQPGDLARWADRELWFPVYEIAKFAGSTGAGDATIAGFLAAFLRGETPEAAGCLANAVGACNVQAPDALSGLKSWDETQRLLKAGWKKVPLRVSGRGWRHDAAAAVWRGPADRG